MTNTDAYKAKLQGELDELTEELKELGILNPQVKEDWIATPEDVDTAEADENVGADRTEDWLERTATLAALETRYNSTMRALQKIAEGTYGTCELCGAEIEADRLEVNPGARTCKAHINDEQDLPA